MNSKEQLENIKSQSADSSFVSDELEAHLARMKISHDSGSLTLQFEKIVMSNAQFRNKEDSFREFDVQINALQRERSADFPPHNK